MHLIYYAYNTELYHHGIKGQRWGIRRYQNKDGSLTEAGKRKYNNSEIKSIKDKYGGRTHYNKLYIKYKRKGYTNAEATVAAYRRIKTEKHIAMVGTAAVAAAVAAHAYYKYSTDRILSKDTDFKRVMAMPVDGGKIQNGQAYVSYKSRDHAKYRGFYGAQLNYKFNSYGKTANIIDYTIKADKNVKVASRKTAKNTFKKLYNTDSEFRKEADEIIKTIGSNLKGPKTVGKKYDLFNAGLVADTKSRDKFYSALKSKGINAIVDMNDKKYSGFNTKDPLIIFSGIRMNWKGHVMDNDELQNAYAKGKSYIREDKNRKMLKTLAKSTVGTAGVVAGGVAVADGVANSKNRKANNKST